MKLFLALAFILCATPVWAGTSIKSSSNGIAVESDAATYLKCSGGIAYIFHDGRFALISPDDAANPVCIDHRAGGVHNYAGGTQAADCREHVMDDARLCSGPITCGGTLANLDLAGCW